MRSLAAPIALLMGMVTPAAAQFSELKSILPRGGQRGTEVEVRLKGTRLEGARDLIIEPGMKEPLPYGPDKVTAGRKLLDGATWLAALGDSNFDLQMMAEAKIGVGIGDKKSMLEGLEPMSHAVRLNLTQ